MIKTPGNYRSVSLKSVPCKVFESIVREKKWMPTICCQRSNTVHERKIMQPIYLLETFEDITSMLNQGGGVDMIYFDYSKAFNSVPHTIYG